MPEINEMGKDDLEKYAKEKFGVDIDKRKKIADLRKQVTDLAGDDGVAQEEEKEAAPMFLRNKLSGRVYPATPFLLKYEEMEPCDENGKLLQST